MKQITKQSWITWTALLLSLPTAYLISISILKYVFEVDGPFDLAAPLLEEMGIKQSLGWNINLVILLGPVVACLLTVFQVVKIKWQFSSENFQFHITVKKRWFPLLVGAFSLTLLAILFLYLFGENCKCY
jgi:hypothetical protein